MDSESSKINLAVLACHPLMVLGLAHYIDDLRLGYRCLLATTSLTGLQAKLMQAAVSVLVMELGGSPQHMARMALQLRRLHAQYPLLNIVVYTGCCDTTILAPLQALARISLIAQQEQPEQIRQDLAQALAEGSVYSPSIKRCLNNVKMSGPNPLTRSEYIVLTYLFAGLSLTEIARLFNRSIKTISAHKRSVVRKLGVHGDAELFKISQNDDRLAGAILEDIHSTESPVVIGP